MKKILSIFLSLMMLASCVASYAEDVSLDEEAAKALMLVSTSPVFGNDEASTEAPSFTFSNDISTVSAQLNGKDVACDVDGKTVTFDVALEQFTDYKATVNVTDINGQSASEKLYFSTSVTNGKSITGSEGSSWHITATSSTSMTTMMNIKYNNNSNFVFYSFPVPELEDGQSLESFVLKTYVYAGANVYTMKFAGDDWDGSSMKSTDEAVAAVFGDVSKKWDKSSYKAADSVKSTDLGGKMYEITADITSYVKDCMDAGEESVEIGFVSNSTINLFGFYAKDSGYKKYQASYTYEVSESKFEIIDVSCEVSGSMLNSASFAILTDVSDINQIVEIRTVSDKTPVDASFGYDETSEKYVLELPLELSADTEYELVFKADSEDDYGNVNADEKILAKFFASSDSYEATQKTDATEEEIFESSVNAETSTVSVFFKNPYYSNSNVEVTIALVGSDEATFSKNVISGTRGTVYLKDISLPESGNYELTVYPQNSSYYLAKDFSFVSAEDTRYLWETIAVAGAASDIAENWDEISTFFNFESEYFENIVDMNGFFKKVEDNRNTSIVEMNAENIILIRTYIDNMAFFTALEQTEDTDVLIKLIESALPVIKANNKDIHDLWVKCCESEYAEKTVESLIDSIESISSIEELTELINDALYVYKVEIVLSLIANADHSSEITDIIIDDENAKLLGIEEYIDEYKAVTSKTKLNESLMTKFDTANDFKEFFANALKDVPKVNDEPVSRPPSNTSSGSSSGKGSSFGGGGATQIVSSAPVSQSPFNPFADVENISWAKDHIVKLYNKGVINGKSQNNFAPYDNITREEVTKLLVTLGKFQTSASDVRFSDVVSGSWYEQYVNTAVSNGIINGIGNSKFGTGMNATRQDIAVMIVNMLSKLGANVDESALAFGDSSQISDYAKNSVSFLASKGIITGDNYGNFNPKANATRAEVAVMLSRVCDIFVKEVK